MVRIDVKGRDREDYITVNVVMRGGIAEKQELQYAVKDYVEKLTVKGQDLIYVRYADKHTNQSLSWIDEQNNLQYTISNSAKSKLTKKSSLEWQTLLFASIILMLAAITNPAPEMVPGFIVYWGIDMNQGE